MRSTFNGTALNQSAPVVVGGSSRAALVVTGPFVATLVAETSGDQGTTWTAHPIRQGPAFLASVNSPGRYYVEDLPDIAGLLFRPRVSAYTSGTVGVVSHFN